MKKNYILPTLVATAVVLTTVALTTATKEKEESDAYSTSTLPTTIDLNDTSASNIRSYYSSLNNLSTSERQGNNLLKNLKTILKNGQKYYSYDSGNAIWQIYEIADRDWELSPASSTTYGTYNSGTNEITNYTYGTSTSAKKNNPYIHALYVNRNVSNQTRAWDDHSQSNWGINREHVWPKAEGFENTGAGGARGDAMHLMAGNGYANNIHSNYYYGYVNTSSSYTDCGTKYSQVSNNYLGKSLTLGGSTNVFEPQDSDKGDIARAIFYMVARYNYLSGSDTGGISSDNPNLALTQSLSDWASSGYQSTTSTKGYMGIMTDLLAWHHADPVDEYEIHRNNLLYTNYTNNRNPFIDFPEWADFIWGSVNYNGRNYVSHNTAPTGYATPSSDTVNGYNSTGTVSVTGISLNKNNTSLIKGTTETLETTITPGNASNQNVTWSTDNSSVATVSNGTITAVNAGNATITVTTQDGGYTATCTVTVTNPTLSSISVSGQQTEFTVGDTFSFGGTVTANYQGGSTADVTDSATFGGYDMSTSGNQTVTVSFGGKTTTYQITIAEAGGDVERTVDDSVTAASGALSGWTSDGTGSAYADGSVKMDGAGDNVYKLDIFTGDASTYMTNLEVTINGKINGTPTAANSYKVEALDSSGNVLASDIKTGSNIVTTSYGDTTFTLSSNLSGCTGIRITYVTKGGGNWGIKSVSWTATYVIPGQSATLTGISLDTSNVTTVYTVGDTFSSEGLIVTAYYDDDSEKTVTPTNISTPDMSTEGNKTITVTYSEDEIEVSDTYQITVNASGGGEDEPGEVEAGTATINYGDTFSPALPTSSGTVNTTSTSHTDTTSGFVFSEQGIYKGNSNNYLMFKQNVGFMFNTTSLGTIDAVSVTYSSSVSTSAKVGVYFGSTIQSTYTTTSNQTISGTSKTDWFYNSVKGYGFFQLSSSNRNMQVTNITVYYHSSDDNVIYKDLSLQGYTNGQTNPSVTFYNKNSQTITGTFARSTGSTNTSYSSTGYVTMNYNNTLTFISSKANIKEVVFTFDSADTYNAALTANTGTLSADYTTWTTDTPVSSLVITASTSSRTRRIKTITVTYYGAKDFATDFLSATASCQNSGNTPNISTLWSNGKANYTRLFTEDLNTLAGADANQAGTTIEQAMARYDFIARKYYSSDNYLNRNLGVGNYMVLFGISSKKIAPYTIIVIFTLVSVAALAIYITNKNRKTWKNK